MAKGGAEFMEIPDDDCPLKNPQDEEKAIHVGNNSGKERGKKR